MSLPQATTRPGTITVLLLPFFLTTVPTNSAAQGPPTFSVVVTEPQELIEEIGATRRIDRAEIEAHQARTLDEALRLVPGIYVRTGGDGTPRIDVRGFRSRHVLLLVDGVPYNSTVDGQFDPASMSTESFQDIKVTYGSSSVLYGDNAMAAVIEITTTPPESSGANVDLSLGTPDQREAGGRLVFAAGRFDATVAANASTDGFRLPGTFAPTSAEDGGLRQNSDRTRRDLRANLAYAISPKVRLGSEWTLGGGSYGVAPTVIDDPTDIFAQRIRYARVDDYLSSSGQVSIAAIPSPRFNVRAWAFRNARREDPAEYDDATYSSMDDPLVAGTFHSRDRTTVSGTSALARIDLGRLGRASISSGGAPRLACRSTRHGPPTSSNGTRARASSTAIATALPEAKSSCKRRWSREWTCEPRTPASGPLIWRGEVAEPTCSIARATDWSSTRRGE